MLYMHYMLYVYDDTYAYTNWHENNSSQERNVLHKNCNVSNFYSRQTFRLKNDSRVPYIRASVLDLYARTCVRVCACVCV